MLIFGITFVINVKGETNYEKSELTDEEFLAQFIEKSKAKWEYPNSLIPFDELGNVHEVAENNLSFIDEQAFVRFFRFVSLVHLDGAEDDQHDGSHIANGGFSNLKAERYDGRRHNWGIETEWVEKAWIVSPELIQVYEREDGESVNINHW